MSRKNVRRHRQRCYSIGDGGTQGRLTIPKIERERERERERRYIERVGIE